jgi:uncharacterized protein (DUF362 family)
LDISFIRKSKEKKEEGCGAPVTRTMEKFLYNIEFFLKNQISRGKFLKICFSSLLVFISSNQFLKLAFAKKEESKGRPKKGIKGNYDLVVAEGDDPYKNTVKAVEAMGGMGRFVKKGDVVVIKPNMAWDRTPEQAANVDPQVVGALVDMAFRAGAKRVNIFDITCNEERRCYLNSGIEEAAKIKGANVYFPNHWNVVEAKFPYKSPMEGWPILRDAIACNVFINVPVLKHHNLTGLTLSMKNLMGVCSGTRGLIHPGIGRKLVDLTEFVSPDLTVIDATRYLKAHGPTGGDLKDVVKLDKVIVATDPTLADAFAAALVEKDPMSIPYIKAAVERNYGNADISKANIHRVKA